MQLKVSNLYVPLQTNENKFVMIKVNFNPVVNKWNQKCKSYQQVIDFLIYV